MKLKEWVTHYQEWKSLVDISGSIIKIKNRSEWHDKVPDQAELLRYILLVEKCCRLAAGKRYSDLLLCVTEEIPHDLLGIPGCMYDKFFRILSRHIQSFK